MLPVKPSNLPLHLKVGRTFLKQDMNQYPNSAKDALTQGAKHYFTGKPCIKGHVCLRTANDNSCVDCTKNRLQTLYRENVSQYVSRAADWKKQNPERAKEIRRKSNAAHKSAKRKLDAKRRAKGRDQICTCCSNVLFDFIYSLARPGIDQVDHIRPLAVGGRHCSKNLQILTIEEHKLKTQKDMAEIAAVRKAAKVLANTTWMVCT